MNDLKKKEGVNHGSWCRDINVFVFISIVISTSKITTCKVITNNVVTSKETVIKLCVTKIKRKYICSLTCVRYVFRQH